MLRAASDVEMERLLACGEVARLPGNGRKHGHDAIVPLRPRKEVCERRSLTFVSVKYAMREFARCRG